MKTCVIATYPFSYPHTVYLYGVICLKIELAPRLDEAHKTFSKTGLCFMSMKPSYILGKHLSKLPGIAWFH